MKRVSFTSSLVDVSNEIRYLHIDYINDYQSRVEETLQGTMKTEEVWILPRTPGNIVNPPTEDREHREEGSPEVAQEELQDIENPASVGITANLYMSLKANSALRRRSGRVIKLRFGWISKNRVRLILLLQMLFVKNKSLC